MEKNNAIVLIVERPRKILMKLLQVLLTKSLLLFYFVLKIIYYRILCFYNLAFAYQTMEGLSFISLELELKAIFFFLILNITSYNIIKACNFLPFFCTNNPICRDEPQLDCTLYKMFTLATLFSF